MRDQVSDRLVACVSYRLHGWYTPAPMAVRTVHQDGVPLFALLGSPQHGSIQALRLRAICVPNWQVVVWQLVPVGQLAGAVKDGQLHVRRQVPL